ncbi:MAG: hypothetical protein AAFR16_12795, partial [Pseudomonadota bacterium]
AHDADADPSAGAAVYPWLRARLADLPFPTLLCIGNHDDRAAFLEVFPEHRDENGFAQRAAQIGGAVALCLDTAERAEGAGRYCGLRRRWLAAQLAALAAAGGAEGALLFMHHHPIPTHLPRMDAIGLRDAAALGEVLSAAEPPPQAGFFGHVHFTLDGALAGVPMHGLPSCNHNGRPDVAAGGLAPDAGAPAVFAHVTMTEGVLSRVTRPFDPAAAAAAARNGA